MFLTQKPDAGERSFLTRAVTEFQRQYPFVSIRLDQTGTLHDRYILSDNQLILLGHGLKDIGNKDSFFIRLPDTMAADLIGTVRDTFDEKWSRSVEIR